METNASSTANVDRISALPPPILHHILSFLSLEQVVPTSVLSKTWKQLWHTFPNVEYNPRRSTFRRQKMVLKYLEQFLLNRYLDAISLEKLTLRVELLSDDPDLESIMNRCLSYAFASNVKELKLDVGCCRIYNVPQIVFYLKSIYVLDFEFCKLEPPRSTVTLLSLRKLCLSFVHVDDEVIRDMVAGCPLIEYIIINNCPGLKSLQLLGLNKLKEIKLDSNRCGLERVYINGVNVHSVDIKVYLEPCEVNVSSCKNLTHLRLDGLSITDKWLYNQISELPFLEYLALHYCMKLRCINISSPRLKELVFERCEELVEFELDTPNLSIFKCFNYVESFSSNALALSQTLLCFISHPVDNEWYLKFIKLLARFNLCSNVLNLQCNHEAVLIPRELREILCPPLTYHKHVSFSVLSEILEVSLANLVDCLLWITPHAETLSIEWPNINFYELSFQFSYKKKLTYEGETPSCCQSLPLSCWKHCIKEVKIECTEKYPIRQINRESFSSEDGDIMEKINDLWKSLLDMMILHSKIFAEYDGP
ncbi:hypothetical protein CUMW_219370 [Citrus unshiu]|uniref:F-box domain-containing protein n=1 Tax=Citrus unshiu TaxID=55188 RepID=A0A2H5QDA5_CITUN|nr:hypothetical protein CUMW_219370 [Citrus unshiu]